MHAILSLVVGVNRQTLPRIHQHDIPYPVHSAAFFAGLFPPMAGSHNDMLSVTIEERATYQQCFYNIGPCLLCRPSSIISIRGFSLCYAPGLGSSRFIRLDMWIARTESKGTIS